jgi:hypothetical protein
MENNVWKKVEILHTRVKNRSQITQDMTTNLWEYEGHVVQLNYATEEGITQARALVHRGTCYQMKIGPPRIDRKRDIQLAPVLVDGIMDIQQVPEEELSPIEDILRDAVCNRGLVD